MQTTLTRTQASVFNTVVDKIKHNMMLPMHRQKIEDRFVSLSGAAGVGK